MIHPALKQFLKGWKLVENYKDKTVTIPGTWDSDIYPYKYFKVIKEPKDPNYKPNNEEDEICLCLECGWPGYDAECIIQLFIRGRDVKKSYPTISVEILKSGGAPMKLYYYDNLITDFTQKVGGWGCSHKIENAKVWVEDIQKCISRRKNE